MVVFKCFGVGTGVGPALDGGRSTPRCACGDLCVNPGGTGGCYASIQQAVTAAGDGDTVQVAQGVYFETVVITKSLTLAGGWNDDFSVQDWDNYVTTIDAEGNGSVVRTALPLGVSAITVTIEGFTLMHGDASASPGVGRGHSIAGRF